MMILKRKRRRETEKIMEENKRRITWRHFVPEFTGFLLTVGGIVVFSLLKEISFETMLSNMVLGCMGIMILGFLARQAYLEEEFDYDNGEHYYRFWICFLICLLCALMCAVLPVAGWPYMAIYVALALFSNSTMGLVGASVLLAVSVALSGTGAVTFLLYFLSGVFGVVLFRNMDDKFKIGGRMFLGLLCLLLCETAGNVLLANERLSFELLVIPVANILISGMLLIGILKLFFSMVVYKNRETYLELYDTQNPILTEYRNRSKSGYMHGVHTAYFCELIALKLSLNSEDLKCVCYYHRMSKEDPGILVKYPFPPAVKAILQEYNSSKPIRRKETAVLVCADTVVNSVQYLLSKNTEKGLDYDLVIDSVFKRFVDNDTFGQCDISMKELKTIQNIFKEEKLYYDFFH